MTFENLSVVAAFGLSYQASVKIIPRLFAGSPAPLPQR